VDPVWGIRWPRRVQPPMLTKDCGPPRDVANTYVVREIICEAFVASSWVGSFGRARVADPVLRSRQLPKPKCRCQTESLARPDTLQIIRVLVVLFAKLSLGLFGREVPGGRIWRTSFWEVGGPERPKRARQGEALVPPDTLQNMPLLVALFAQLSLGLLGGRCWEDGSGGPRFLKFGDPGNPNAHAKHRLWPDPGPRKILHDSWNYLRSFRWGP
jgi:hypothetical protein